MDATASAVDSVEAVTNLCSEVSPHATPVLQSSLLPPPPPLQCCGGQPALKASPGRQEAARLLAAEPDGEPQPAAEPGQGLHDLRVSAHRRGQSRTSGDTGAQRHRERTTYSRTNSKKPVPEGRS